MDCILNAITANAGFIDPVILQLGIFVVPDKLYAAEIRDVLPVLNVVNPGGGVNGEFTACDLAAITKSFAVNPFIDGNDCCCLVNDEVS